MTQFEDSIGTKLYASIIDIMREQFKNDVPDSYQLYPLKNVRAISSSDFQNLFGKAKDNPKDQSLNILDAIKVVDVYANTLLEGDDIVSEKDGNLWQVYNNILTHGAPVPDTLPNEQDYIAVLKSPDYEKHKIFRREIQLKELEILKLREESGVDDLVMQKELKILESELVDLENSWILTGKKKLFEKAEAFILQSETTDTSTEISEDMLIWKQARDKYRANLLTDSLTGQDVPVTRIDMKPDQNWQQVTKSFGDDIKELPELFFFGTEARLISMSMEFTLLPINRTGWFEENIIHHMNWQWASLFKSDHVLTDGTGYGELNYLTSHIVAVRNVEMKIWVQTESEPTYAAFGGNISKKTSEAVSQRAKLKIGGFDGRVFAVKSIDGTPIELEKNSFKTKSASAITNPVTKTKETLTAKQIRSRNIMRERGNIKDAANSRKALFRTLVQTGKLSTESALDIDPSLQKSLTPLLSAAFSGRKEKVIQQSVNLLTGILRRRNNRINYEISIQLPAIYRMSPGPVKIHAKIFKCNRRGNKKKQLHETDLICPNAINYKLHPGLYIVEIESENQFLWSNLTQKFLVEKGAETVTVTMKSKWSQAVCERLTQDSDLMILGYMAKRLPRLPQIA